MTAADVRRAGPGDAAAIADIYNLGILARTATFETEPRSAEDVARWLERGDVIVVSLGEGGIEGFASAHAYRPRACYDGVREFSVYVHPRAQRRGHGRALLESLIAEARAEGAWKLVARIFSENTASRKLCRAVGFREVGTYERHGKLDGRWLDCVIVEKLID
ncbi:MAG TPA: arsinothricin resistance N-acetyltransferase ArsN1 family A [Aestuariivirgaceae bacterium]|nr:arsinothricin resistance N-acetyltransferase ArsN1 family A [Aestuariivirgaceae bacterium]